MQKVSNGEKSRWDYEFGGVVVVDSTSSLHHHRMIGGREGDQDFLYLSCLCLSSDASTSRDSHVCITDSLSSFLPSVHNTQQHILPSSSEQLGRKTQLMGGGSSSHVHPKTGPSYGSSNTSFRIKALRCFPSQSPLFILLCLYAFIITIVAIRRSRVSPFSKEKPAWPLLSSSSS